MQSITIEPDQDSTADLEEIFHLKDKCLCVKWFYRAKFRHLPYFFCGLSSFVLGSLLTIVFVLGKLGVGENAKLIFFYTIFFIYLALFFYGSSKFYEKEERKDTWLYERHQRKWQQQQLPMMLREQDERSKRNKPSVQEDSISLPESGVQLVIPVVKEGRVPQSACVELHYPTMYLQEPLELPSTSRRIPDTASSSEKLDSFKTGEVCISVVRSHDPHCIESIQSEGDNLEESQNLEVDVHEPKVDTTKPDCDVISREQIILPGQPQTKESIKPTVKEEESDTEAYEETWHFDDYADLYRKTWQYLTWQ